MKNIQLLLLLTFISSFLTNPINAQCNDVTIDSLTNPGPFEVGTLSEVDGIRNGPNYNGATIYYPTNANQMLASIAIIPGFTGTPSTIQEWGPFYASHGIVTIIIGTNSLLDLPEARAIALLDALETIKQENIRESSPLEGSLNLNQLAVSGHSMGGGGAQRAAVIDDTISGVVALCPWLNNPELNHQSPVLIFSGQDDTIAPPSQHADIHYNITPNTTNKLLYEIENGNHSVANSPNGGNGSVGKIALSWLKLYLEDKNCYCPLLTDNLLLNPTDASRVEESFECEILGVNNQEFIIGVYPNPSKNIVNIKINENVNYKIISTLGQKLSEGYLSGDIKQIDLSEFSTGLYYLHIKGQVIKLIKYD
ncbi:MAG: Poly(ethylene terephthalate) hydrolase [Polaribacter sp. SA4-10]|nr:MAG: Poly(ethylene terephthalate) hydrolase [Polaribacter sp. SA4-10]|tara:strand:+ start:332 stop:1429 length:1098 start_codon:yes stop_codon:yes gene_type:complete